MVVDPDQLAHYRDLLLMQILDDWHARVRLLQAINQSRQHVGPFQLGQGVRGTLGDCRPGVAESLAQSICVIRLRPCR